MLPMLSFEWWDQWGGPMLWHVFEYGFSRGVPMLWHVFEWPVLNGSNVATSTGKGARVGWGQSKPKRMSDPKAVELWSTFGRNKSYCRVLVALSGQLLAVTNRTAEFWCPRLAVTNRTAESWWLFLANSWP